jgi:hypothetical protein
VVCVLRFGFCTFRSALWTLHLRLGLNFSLWFFASLTHIKHEHTDTQTRWRQRQGQRHSAQRHSAQRTSATRRVRSRT